MYQTAHILVTASGSLPGSEKWSCGLRSYGLALPGQEQAQSDACLAAWTALVQNSDAQFSSGVTLERVTFREISPAGITTGLWESAPGSAVTGATSPNLPNQCAVVVTLLTARPGRSGKGRIYLPLLGLAASNNGRLPAGRAALIATPAAQLLSSINAALLLGNDATDNNVAVQSQATTSASTVTSIRVGDIVDTQRRRRDSLVESYSAATVTTNAT